MNTIEYENHRRAAVRAYANQFATGQYRVRLDFSPVTLKEPIFIFSFWASLIG
jgi:hypothetical protein